MMKFFVSFDSALSNTIVGELGEDNSKVKERN